MPLTRTPEAVERARGMRDEGRSLGEISTALGVSRSAVSSWLGGTSRSDSNRARRMAKTARLEAEAAATVGELSERDLFIAGAVAYWAEGAKAKPWDPSARVAFTNSDPGLVGLFLAFLRLIGVDRERLIFRVAIHEGSDELAARQFWSKVVGVPPSDFARTTLKRHRPTTRHDVGTDYKGCLVVVVRRSTDLNRQISGWCAGLAAALPTAIREYSDSRSAR